MLPRGQVFSIMYPQLHEEAVCLFNLLHSAKDFDTFYNTAVWARFNMNEHMFIYALSVAVLHRSDTQNVRLPPLYEVLPNLFFNDEVLHKAYHLGMGDTSLKKTVGGVNYYMIHSNYSGWYLVRNNLPEQKLSYFTEDVGLGQFYFMINHDFPYWMNSVQYKLPTNVRGEMYLFLHKQLLVRYYLERLSNDMGEIDYVDFHQPIVTGYYPTMHHHNGLPFPQRKTDATVPLYMHKYVQVGEKIIIRSSIEFIQLFRLHNKFSNFQKAEHLETRITDAIDSGYVEDVNGQKINIYTQGGLNILGNIIQGNADALNPKYYGKYDLLCRKIFGFSLEPNSKYQITPSTLEIFSTSTRDPVFYSMYKNVVTYLLRFVFKECIRIYILRAIT